MTDVTDRLAGLDQLRPPDLWEDIRSREPRSEPPAPSGAPRIVAAAVALLVAAAGIVIAGRALLTDKAPVTVLPITSKLNGKIAFSCGESRFAYGLCVIEPDGSGAKRLVDLEQASSPDWSPDGSTIVFQSGGGIDSGGASIHVVDADGSGLRELTKGRYTRYARYPDWSPDGKRIAFSMEPEERGLGADIFLMDADGTDLVKAVESSGYAWFPKWSPDGTRIAYTATTSPEASDSSLYLYDLGAGMSRRLTNAPDVQDFGPAWSPDGAALAFIRNGRIHVIRPDGGDERELELCGNECRDVFDVDWSPDGRSLVFARSWANGQLVVMNADGTNARRLTTGYAWSGSPAWQSIPAQASAEPSPYEGPSLADNGEIWFRKGGGEGGTWIESVLADGTHRSVLFSDTDAFGNDNVGAGHDWSADGARLAFLDASGNPLPDAPTGSAWEVYTMNPDGTDRVQVTHDGGFDGLPSWSPDGTRIVYSTDRTDPDRPACEVDVTCTEDVFVVTADGSSQAQLTADPADDTQPDWSPDGTRIVFVSTRFDPAGDLLVITADGTNVVALTFGPMGESQPRWSPDGSTIAFVRQDGAGFDLYVMDADGSNPRLIARGLPTSHSVEPDIFKDFTWSPDGTQIAFVGVGESGGGTTLSVIDADGTNLRKLVEDPEGIGEPAWRPIAGG